jgi:hypothetical protein
MRSAFAKSARILVLSLVDGFMIVGNGCVSVIVFVLDACSETLISYLTTSHVACAQSRCTVVSACDGTATARAESRSRFKC